MFILCQKLYRSVELGEYAASVYVACEKHRCPCRLSHSHVYDVVFTKIYLRRTSCTLNYDDVVLFGEFVICLHNIRHKRIFVLVILRRRHLSAHFTEHDYLTAYIARRFEQDGIHAHIRLNSGSFRLHNLSTSHLHTVSGNIAVQCHVLTFERSNLVAVLLKNPAKRCTEQALSRT